MSDAGRRPIRRVLMSVYDKTDLVPTAEALVAAGAEIVSTGSTARVIAEAGLPVTPVEQVTGFPECLDGRVKTLHPAVHAGLLADLRLESHRDQLGDLDIAPFDLLVSNLYPFSETVASGATADECVEQIDIGGPAMVRSSAKNHASVAVVTSPGAVPGAARGAGVRRVHPGRAAGARRRGVRAHCRVRRGRGRLAAAGGGRAGRAVPDLDRRDLPADARAPLRREPASARGALPHRGGRTRARRPRAQLHGKEMSYNNYVDADAARRAAYDFDEPAVAIIKHANPCGVAVGTDVAEAHRRAHACDPVSAFGGVIAANAPVSVEMARQVAEVFTEVILAPAYADGAVEVLRRRRTCASSSPSRTGERGRAEPRDRRRPAGPGRPTRSTPSTTAAKNWQLVAGDPAGDARAGRPGVRLARSPRGQVERHPAGRGRRLGRGRHGPGQPGRLLPAGGAAGGGSGRRVGGRVGRVLPVRRRAADPARRRRRRASSSPAGRCATRRSSPRSGQRERRCTSPAPGTSSTERHALAMTAQILDGKALAATVKADLTERVAALGSAASPRGWARCWSATTPVATPTCAASTATARRSASLRSRSSCPPRPARRSSSRRSPS